MSVYLSPETPCLSSSHKKQIQYSPETYGIVNMSQGRVASQTEQPPFALMEASCSSHLP